MFLGLVGCAVNQGKVYVKDGKEYGVTSSQVWRGRWWNYYERGSSYAEGEFWPEAIADLQEAIKQRDTGPAPCPHVWFALPGLLSTS